MVALSISASSAQPPLLLDVPDDDLAEWKDVPEKERARVRLLWRIFGEMLRARSLKAGAQAAALRYAHFGWGFSARTLVNLFAVYRNGGHKPGDFRKTGPIFGAGDWRVLLRNYRAAHDAGVPAEFKRWLGEQWAQFRGRDDGVLALHRHVVQELWLKSAPIPGYGTIEDWCRTTGRARPHPLLWRPGELPDGWHARSWYRHLPKRASTRKQVQHGYLAAHTHQPDMVLTDRSNIRALEYVILDDFRGNNRCTHFQRGLGEIVYPLFVAAMDAASTVIVGECAKPRARKRPEAENEAERNERHGVSQDMALLCIVQVLMNFGLPPWGITFVHENAAACIPAWAKAFLAGLYGDRIKFEKTSIFNERMMAHGFEDHGGAPWSKGKAMLESFWHLLSVQTANLPGTTGARYDDMPGDLKAAEKYLQPLLARARDAQEFAALFRSPLLSFDDTYAAFRATLKLLRFRPEHDLQGFDRVQEWRRSPSENFRPWREFLLLPAAEQDEISADKGNIISRRECPAERFCRLLAGVQLTVIDEDVLVFVQGPRRAVRVRDGKITISATAEHGDDVLVFRESGHPLLDEAGEGHEYEAAIAPDGGRLVLAEGGAVLGSVARQGRVDVTDKAALRREMGRVAAARTADRAMLREYLLIDTDEALAELRRQNEAAKAAPAIAAAEQQERVTAKTVNKKQTAAVQQRNQARAAQLAAAAQNTFGH